eukprot:545113_1
MICPQKQGQRTKVITKKMAHQFDLSLMDGMCIHCINTLLTKITLNDIIVLIKMYSDLHETCDIIYNLSLWSLDVLVNSTIHPKIPMLMAKSLIFDKTSYTKETYLMRQAHKGKEFPISKSHDFNWLCKITMAYCNIITSTTDTYACRFTGVWLR